MEPFTRRIIVPTDVEDPTEVTRHDYGEITVSGNGLTWREPWGGAVLMSVTWEQLIMQLSLDRTTDPVRASMRFIPRVH
jgi:hypothetical protein